MGVRGWGFQVGGCVLRVACCVSRVRGSGSRVHGFRIDAGECKQPREVEGEVAREKGARIAAVFFFFFINLKPRVE